MHRSFHDGLRLYMSRSESVAVMREVVSLDFIDKVAQLLDLSGLIRDFRFDIGVVPGDKRRSHVRCLELEVDIRKRVLHKQ